MLAGKGETTWKQESEKRVKRNENKIYEEQKQEKKDEKQMMLNKQKKDVEGAKWETKCDRTPNVKCRGGGTCPSD